METNKKSGKVILFEGRKYHCVAVDAEPWNHPEVESRVPHLQARLPNLKFTPCRWRFVCDEGVLAVVPIGYFDARRPDAIPVEIRKKTEWYRKTQPLTEEDRNLYRMARPSKPESLMPPKGTEKVIEDEYATVFNYLSMKLPGVSGDLLDAIMELMEYEAIYENGNRDYFIRVEVCEATLDLIEARFSRILD